MPVVGLVNAVDDILVYHEICTGASTIRNDIKVAGDAPTIRKSAHALFIIVSVRYILSRSLL